VNGQLSGRAKRGAGALRTARWLVLAAAVGACASQPASKPAASAGSATGKPGGAEAAPAAAGAPDPWAGRKDLLAAPPPPKPSALALPKIDRFTLPNGLQVLVVARRDLPIASFGIAVRAGGFDERRDGLGVADFVASMLRRGTKTRSADDISRAIDFVGGSLDAQASNESTSASCSVLSRDTALCLDLLSDILLRPTFPESEMPEVRDQLLAAIASRYDNPHALANLHFDHRLFGDKHPEGWVLMPEDVRKITRADLEKFWKTYIRPNRAVLAIAGDVDVARLRADVAKVFGPWQRATVPFRPTWRLPPLYATRVLLVDRPDLTQATMVFGHAGIEHADPRWYATTLMNYVLGGSDFSSRLMTEVRAKRGLTYGIGSTFGASLYQGAFRVVASTKTGTTVEALQAAVAEVRRMKQEGPSASELEKAKGYYAGSTPFSLQTASGIAAALVAAELHGLGDAYVRELPVRLAAVDVEAARATGRDLLRPDALQVVIVGRGDAIGPQLAKAGLSFERVGFKDPIVAAAPASAAPAKKP
jgi:zinc protease